MNTLEQIKSIRLKTGAGVVDIKKALEEAKGDENEAMVILRKKGRDKAIGRSYREAREGVVASYVHTNGKIGSLVKVLCETDFVARNEDFLNLAKDIALHIAASNPQYIDPGDVPESVVRKEEAIWCEQLAAEGKAKNLFDTILAGKERKYREEISLLAQPFVKNPEKTVGDVIAEAIARIGENIQVGGFQRFEI